MTRIFISYSRTDEIVARQLATALSELDADIWIDIEDIPAGMKWSSAIQQGLDTADALIVIISPESMSSRNVEDEWQYFLDHGKPIIPIFLRPAKIHFQLNRIQWIDFKDQAFDVALLDLYQELKRNGIHISRPPSPLVESPSHSHGHASPPSPETRQLATEKQSDDSPNSNRLLMTVGAVVLGLIIIGVIGMSIFSSLSNDNDAQSTLTAQEDRIASLEAMTQTFNQALGLVETQSAVSTQDAMSTQLAQATQNVISTDDVANTQIAGLTQTAQAIPTATATEAQVFVGPVDSNNWQPIERDFNGVPMVLVPSGQFTFGATTAQFEANFALCREKLNEDSCNALRDEVNGQNVRISNPYWIDKYEVSQAQYGSSGRELPQVDITSGEAQTYCEARGGSLPNESQWEYAAKGVEGWRYPWGETWDLNTVRSNICDANCSNAWHESVYDDGYAEASPVTEIQGSASWVGAYNMAGNVWEWTSDEYSSDTTNTLRGGGWTWIAAESTTTSRAAGIAQSASFYGFRCVRQYNEGDLSS